MLACDLIFSMWIVVANVVEASLKIVFQSRCLKIYGSNAFNISMGMSQLAKHMYVQLILKVFFQHVSSF
jgi:hypothetical protein